ncbi:unnamed protein product [Bursaphelenchus xylophilus]|uniref:(pine wood nematode) hypothetical protein n=1 Tax=Bursaphelenchus xylophilus TaxID=6326 RepID=A0A1I7RNC3_BURXY|nr:unnamed protein product [Bursaphelenchus xylophilus]CAG9123867.1 unnamed protein product [Bursaphelenchus xylophilus]
MVGPVFILLPFFLQIRGYCIGNNGSVCEATRDCYYMRYLDDGIEQEELGCDHQLYGLQKGDDMATQQCFRNESSIHCVCRDRPTFECNRIFSMKFQAVEYVSTQAAALLVIMFIALIWLFSLSKTFFKFLGAWPKEKEVPWYIHYFCLFTEMLITLMSFYTFLHFKLTLFRCDLKATNSAIAVPAFYRMPEYDRGISFASSSFFATSSLSLLRVLILLKGKNQLNRKDVFIWSVFVKLICLMAMSFSHRYLQLTTYDDLARKHSCSFREDLLDFSVLCNQLTLVFLCGSFFVDLVYYISPSFESKSARCDNEVYSSTIEAPLLPKESPEIEIDVKKMSDDIYSIFLQNKSERIVIGSMEKNSNPEKIEVSDSNFHLEPRQTCFVTVVGPAQSSLTSRFGFATDSTIFQRHIILK